jgi:hypothetical protein
MGRWPPLRTSFAEVTVTSSTTDEYIGWNVPTEIDLARMQLEETLQVTAPYLVTVRTAGDSLRLAMQAVASRR